MKANVNISNLFETALTFKDGVGYLAVKFAGKEIGKGTLSDDEVKQISFRINSITKNVVELDGAKDLISELTGRLIESEGIEQSLEQLRNVIAGLRSDGEAKDQEINIRGQSILNQGTQLNELNKRFDELKIEHELLIQTKDLEQKSADETIATLRNEIARLTALPVPEEKKEITEPVTS